MKRDHSVRRARENETKAKVIHHGEKVRITLDIAESLVKEIDEIQRPSVLSEVL